MINDDACWFPFLPFIGN